MELKVLSEKEMKQLMKFDKPHAVISIRSFGAKGIRFTKNENRKALIKLEFDDVVPENLGKGVDFQLITDEDARRISRFIKKNIDIDYLLINCEAGISRSAAVAKSICEWKTDIEPVLRFTHRPNPYVYDLVLKELQNG